MDRYNVSNSENEIKRSNKNQELYQSIGTNTKYTNFVDVRQSNAYMIDQNNSSNYTREKYQHMKEYVLDFNDEAVGSMLNALSKYKFPEEEQEKFDKVMNLAAQAGVRYSITNPYSYLQSNIVGFLNILEACRNYGVKHLIYASSSSVYGLNTKVPYNEEDKVDSPVSLYAASKKSNELMAHAYSKLYGFATTGLRFFTVYGPWGRPDMSPMLFAGAIREGKPIKVFNNGDMIRDFTYIDDIVEGTIHVIDNMPCAEECPNGVAYKVYNIGCSNPVKLMDFISEIEEAYGKKAEKIFMPMQPGDVYQTNADTTKLETECDYKPHWTLHEGIQEFMEWYKSDKNPL